MELVLNKPEYWEFIRTLRNHPDVKGGFIQQEDIERESHEKYMLKYGFFLNQLMEIHSDAFAKVKLENEASMKLFEACGFKKKYYILEKE